MPLEEISNLVYPISFASGRTDRSATRPSDVHPWAGGKKVLKPVEEGEKLRSLRLRKKSGLDDLSAAAVANDIENTPVSPGIEYCCTADLIDANDHLAEELATALAAKEEVVHLLNGLRHSHSVVCAQLEAARNELGSQEDELFVLRETHEENAQVMRELRKAKEFAEVEREKEAEIADLRAETAELRSRVANKERELEEAKHTAAEQQEACTELLEEQKKLETAYEEALAELESWKVQQGIEDVAEDEEVREEADSVADASQEWHKIEASDLTLTPPLKGRAAGRNNASRFLTKRRRTPSIPLLFSSPPATGDVATVKNDVEQLKQTIAMLVRERSASFEQPRPSSA
ncbi:hypothetical protein JCM10213_007299 [Rhodosporidiobolus nylandii]